MTTTIIPAAPFRRRLCRAGFSLAELAITVVILGIVAAIAIPRMSLGSASAADAALSQDLALLRNAIDMYQTDHNGLLPAGDGPTVAALLVFYSNRDGSMRAAVKDAGPAEVAFGGYLRAIPEVPVGRFKGASAIAVSNTRGVDAPAGPGIGWLYNSADGTVKPCIGSPLTDSTGMPYSRY